MSTRRVALISGLLGCGALAFAAAAAPALAGCGEHPGYCWEHAHRAIYHKHNHIAFLEADPNAGDGYKGPIIDHLHRKILRIRAHIGPRWPHWPTPCCYSRRPIYIR